MPRFVAFLRAINVGGRTVKMDALRRPFVSLGFGSVETVIASGNVVFEADAAADEALERAIEASLAEALGYEVGTYVRTIPELAAVAMRQPFDLAREPDGAVVYTLFLKKLPPPATREAIGALATANDEAAFGRREVYWLRRARVKESDLFGTRFGKLIGTETTSRNFRTVERIVAKYGG